MLEDDLKTGCDVRLTVGGVYEVEVPAPHHLADDLVLIQRCDSTITPTRMICQASRLGAQRLFTNFGDTKPQPQARGRMRVAVFTSQHDHAPCREVTSWPRMLISKDWLKSEKACSVLPQIESREDAPVQARDPICRQSSGARAKLMTELHDPPC